MTAPSTSAPNSLQVGLIVLSRRGGLPRPPYLGGFAPPTTPASRLRLAYPRPPPAALTPAARRAPHAAAPLRRHSAPPLAYGRGPKTCLQARVARGQAWWRIGGSGTVATTSATTSAAAALPRIPRRCAITGTASDFTSSGSTKSRPANSASACEARCRDTPARMPAGG